MAVAAKQNGNGTASDLSFVGEPLDDYSVYTGQRVAFFKGNTGVAFHGIVERECRGKVHVLVDDDTRVSGSARCFRESTKPAPVRVAKVCPFHVGDRVEYNEQKTGNLLTGTVKGILPGKRISVNLDTGGSTRWGWKNFRPSKTVAPRIVNQFAVGDRVECEHKGETLHGTVKSIRNERITMSIDGREVMTLSGRCTLFRPSTKPAPAAQPAKKQEYVFIQTDVPNSMDAYSVTKFKPTPVRKNQWEGHEGNGYSATILRDGKPVLEAYNQGVGGEGDLTGKPEEVKAFMDALKATWVQFGGNADSYAISDPDIWVWWNANESPCHSRPKGRLFADVVKEMTAFENKCRK